jgi:hypothetical protein
MRWATFWASYFTNSSGHPAKEPQQRWTKRCLFDASHFLMEIFDATDLTISD